MTYYMRTLGSREQSSSRINSEIINSEIIDGNYTLFLPVAGFSENQVSVFIEDGIITIFAEKKIRGNNLTLSRSFRLNDSVDIEKITAKVENGEAIITLPNKQREVKKIKIL